MIDLTSRRTTSGPVPRRAAAPPGVAEAETVVGKIHATLGHAAGPEPRKVAASGFGWEDTRGPTCLRVSVHPGSVPQRDQLVASIEWDWKHQPGTRRACRAVQQTFRRGSPQESADPETQLGQLFVAVAMSQSTSGVAFCRPQLQLRRQHRGRRLSGFNRHHARIESAGSSIETP